MILSYDRDELEGYFRYEDLYRYLRFPDKNSIPERLLLEINKELINVYNLVNAEVFYKEFSSFSIKNGGILLSDVFINSYVLSRIASEALSIYVFILTAGSRIDIEIEEANKNGKYFRAQVLDACGSVLVETIVDKFMRDIEVQLFESGYALSARYSPGYCDISIDQQSPIFSILRDQNVSVILTESYQMIPLKSISGLFFKIRKSDAERFKRYYIFCSECKNRLCKYYHNK